MRRNVARRSALRIDCVLVRIPARGRHCTQRENAHPGATCIDRAVVPLDFTLARAFAPLAVMLFATHDCAQDQAAVQGSVDVGTAIRTFTKGIHMVNMNIAVNRARLHSERMSWCEASKAAAVRSTRCCSIDR